MVTTVTPLPALDRNDPDFRNDVDTFFATQLPTFTTQVNTLATEVETIGNTATTQASIATTQATIATTQAGISTTKANEAAASAQAALNAPGTNANSTTSNTIGTGVKSFTIETGKNYAVGMYVYIAATAGIGNYMYGQISAFNSGAGTISITVEAVQGSGTFTAWTITPSAPNTLVLQSVRLPNIQPSLVYAFSDGVLPQEIQATSGGACRLLGRNLQYLDAPARVPALDYDYTTGNCKGLTVEGTRVFTTLWSSDLTNAAWIKSEVTATASGLSFAGEPMYTVAKTTTTTSASVRQVLQNTVNPINHVASLMLAAGTSTQVDVALFGANAPIEGINSDSTALITSGPGTLTRISGARWRITGLSSTVPTFVDIHRAYVSTAETTSIYIYPDTSSSTTSGASVLVGRVAVERGVGILKSTSYARTTSSTFTRDSDFYFVSGLDFTNNFNPEEGTVVVSCTPNYDSKFGVILRIDDGTDANRLVVQMTSGNVVRYNGLKAGVDLTNIDISPALSGRLCAAITFKNGEAQMSVNGGTTTVVTGIGSIPVRNRLVLGSYSNNVDPLNNNIHSVAFYSKACTPSQLQALSGYWRG